MNEPIRTHTGFLPTTRKEIKALGWKQPDIILITGDSYIDSPYVGAAVIGKVLLNAGFKTAIIAQPDVDSDKDIKRLGEPGLFWGVTAGCVDSLVANYTALKKRRKQDDYTPGGVNNRRPDRAVIRYANLIRKYYKDTVPIVLGGIEASLRRICHYDFWSDSIRKSILFDAKADVLVYGMGENAAVRLADAFQKKQTIYDIKGICYISKEKRPGLIELPSYDEVKTDKQRFINMFNTFYQHNDPASATGLVQKQDSRYLVQNPPSEHLDRNALDEIHDLTYQRDQHPYYKKMGDVRALDTIRFSIPSHRGCYGECSFCSISVHQGRTVQWRSETSIINEATAISKHPDFKGTITDVGGPTANMYGFECRRKLKKGSCRDKRCLHPSVCKSLLPDHASLLRLLKKLRRLKGIKNVFSASGIRHDLVFSDKTSGDAYIKQIAGYHVSGQLKLAPEHSEPHILELMGKPGNKHLLDFKRTFDAYSKQAGKKQFLTYYFIAAHPGCSDQDMKKLKAFTREKLNLNPEQVQIFTPTPSTYSSLMYYTGRNPFTGEKIFVEKDGKRKNRQKEILINKKRRH